MAFTIIDIYEIVLPNIFFVLFEDAKLLVHSYKKIIKTGILLLMS